MATWDLASSGAILEMAGTGVDLSTFVGLTSGQRLERAYDRAEGTILAETDKDWVTTRASANFSGAVQAAIVSHAAVDMMQFNPGGYTSSQYNQGININLDIVRKNVAFLKDTNKQATMGV